MSVEFCSTCSQRIDTDWNVEGEYRNGEYMCERCCAKQDDAADCEPTGETP